MASLRSLSLETLPLLVLERICQYLADADVPWERRSLCALSLTSRSCCTVAAAQRFCQIQLKILASDELESKLSRWTDAFERQWLLSPLRQLKVSGVMPDEERRIHRLTVDQQDKEGEEYEYEYDSSQREFFDMHEFCRPSRGSYEYGERYSYPDHVDSRIWQFLASFITRLSALSDLVWAYCPYMPRSILSAIHSIGCRLHIHCFRLPSLTQHRDRPRSIGSDDYMLASSPALFSIVVTASVFDGGGDINYTQEAILRLVSGVALD